VAAIVKSVERVQVTITAATEPVTVNLSKGQDEGQCVPWHTAYWPVTAGTDMNDEIYYEVEIVDNSGTAAVKISAAARSATQDQVIEVAVVEFDATINVQQVNYDMADGTTTVDVTVASVGTQASAFILLSAQNEGTANDDFDNACLRWYWDGAATDSVLVDRRQAGDTGSMNGTLYIVDCDSGEFTVEYATLARGSNSDLTDDITISATVIANTFLIHGYTCSQTGDDMFDSSWHADMTDTTTVRIRRGVSGTPTATISEHVVQVVECQNSEWSVQHAEATLPDDEPTVTDDITAVDLTKAMVIGTHLEGGLSCPRTNVTDGPSKIRMSHGLTFVDTDTIQIKREIAVSTSYVQYQVVEWDLVSAGAGGVSLLTLLGTG